MKNLFTAVILGIAFAGVSLAHTSSEEKAGERHAGTNSGSTWISEYLPRA